MGLVSSTYNKMVAEYFSCLSQLRFAFVCVHSPEDDWRVFQLKAWPLNIAKPYLCLGWLPMIYFCHVYAKKVFVLI